MDVRYSFRGLLFEWDQVKARTNLKKHGVSFETACEAFLDPLLLLKDAGDKDRETQAVIGETGDERLLLCGAHSPARRDHSDTLGPSGYST